MKSLLLIRWLLMAEPSMDMGAVDGLLLGQNWGRLLLYSLKMQDISEMKQTLMKNMKQ